MKLKHNILLVNLAIGLLACYNQNAEKNKIEKLKKTDSEPSISENNECVRAQAQPIIRKNYFPNTIFVLQPDSLTGIETVIFNNGDRLIIRNWGCEYYVLTFRFETSRYQADITDLEYWFKAAHRMMADILHGIDAPINIEQGLVALDSYIQEKKNDHKNLEIGKSIYFGKDEVIQNFVTVDCIERITSKKFAVTISFAMGPL